MQLDVETQRVLSCVLRASATGHASPVHYEFGIAYGWSLLNDDEDAEPICSAPSIEVLTKLGYDTSPLESEEGVVGIERLAKHWPREIAALQLAVCDATVALTMLRRSVAKLRSRGSHVDVGAGPYCGILAYRSLTQRPGYPGGKVIRQLMYDAKSNRV